MRERVNLFPSPILITHQPPTGSTNCVVSRLSRIQTFRAKALSFGTLFIPTGARQNSVCEPTDRNRSRRVINWLATKERSEATKQQEARENGSQYHPTSCHFVCSQAPRESTDESLTSFPAIQPPQYREGPGICRMCYWFRAFFYPVASGRAP